MLRTTIYNDLRRHVHGAGVITAGQLADFLGLKNVSRVKAEYLDGLEHINNRYFISDVAERLQKEIKR